jgi:hypothetical protein
MVRLVAIALVVMCVVLTVAFLASLRGIAELRLRVAADSGLTGPPHLVIGRRLPDRLLELLGEHGTESIVAFLSGTCGSCLQLASELDRTAAPVVAVVVGGSDEVVAAVPEGVPVITGDVAEQLRIDMTVQTFPTAVVQRDGYIVVIGQGSGADAAADLDDLWRQGVPAPQEARS